MERNHLQEAVLTSPATARWSPWFVLAGLTIIAVYVVVGLGLASVAAGYFALPKVERDAAQAGSAILAQWQYLQSTGTWLEPFKFSGLSLIITGIVLNLAAIIRTLRTRAAVLHLALSEMKGGEAR
ncbi:MAG: hypothetical protein HY334_01750 [Armatimonadetes bacterium]|nr:hypothetical protein [Armatimonadota bacterium]